MRSKNTTLLTSYFAAAGEPQPSKLALPNAPHANPAITLPRYGLNLLFGRYAPRVMSVAMQRAVSAGYQPYNATLTAMFERSFGSIIDQDDLPAVDVLLLLRSRLKVALAEDVHEHFLGYLGAAGITPVIRYKPSAFELVGQYPHLLARLLTEPAYQHLKGVCYSVPGVGTGPSVQLFYLRDLSVITRIQTIGSDSEPLFRLPTATELADLVNLAPTYNPLLDSAAANSTVSQPV